MLTNLRREILEPGCSPCELVVPPLDLKVGLLDKFPRLTTAYSQVVNKSMSLVLKRCITSLTCPSPMHGSTDFRAVLHMIVLLWNLDPEQRLLPNSNRVVANTTCILKSLRTLLRWLALGN